MYFEMLLQKIISTYFLEVHVIDDENQTKEQKIKIKISNYERNQFRKLDHLLCLLSLNYVLKAFIDILKLTLTKIHRQLKIVESSTF